MHFSTKLLFPILLVVFIFTPVGNARGQEPGDYEINPDDYGSNDEPVLYERIIEEREAEAERERENPTKETNKKRSNLESSSLDREDEEPEKPDSDTIGSSYMSKYGGNISNDYKPSYTPPEKGVMLRRIPQKRRNQQ
jgi:hypothetical protein